jgi:hypothetical protein
VSIASEKLLLGRRPNRNLGINENIILRMILKKQYRMVWPNLYNVRLLQNTGFCENCCTKFKIISRLFEELLASVSPCSMDLMHQNTVYIVFDKNTRGREG